VSRLTLVSSVTQVVHEPVGARSRVRKATPSMMMLSGRLTVDPFATERHVRDAGNRTGHREAGGRVGAAEVGIAAPGEN